MPGLLVKFRSKKGQNVAKGELIAQLRQDEFQARLNALQGQLDQARAALTALQRASDPKSGSGGKRRCGRPRRSSNNARTEFNRFAQLRRSMPMPSRRWITTAPNHLSGGPRRI